MSDGYLVKHSKTHKQLNLLVCLLCLILSAFFVPGDLLGLTVIDSLFTLMLIAAIYIFWHRRAIIITTLILALPMLMSRWILHVQVYAWIQIVTYLFGTLFFLFLSVVLIKTILEETRVTFDTIYGSISVYLVLGLAFAFLYAIFTHFDSGALIYQNGKPLEKGAMHLQTLIYYSFTTLTTLGFGDINPVAPPVRILSALQAVTGQIYLVVLVARLVGLHIAHSHSRLKNK